MQNLLFGEVHSKFERKGQEAVNHLLKVKNGEVPNAIFNKHIGWIDIVWGFEGTKRSDGYGLSKIKKYHPEVTADLAEIIKSLDLIGRSENRYKLENKKYMCAISRVWFENKKTWLLTIFEKKKPQGV